MKNAIKIGIPIIATLGVITVLLFDSKSMGLLITLFYAPLLLIYALLAFKSNQKTSETKLKSLFTFVATLTTLVIVLYVLLKTMHWPFYGIAKLACAILCIFLLAIGLTYILVNRKQLSSQFTYELIIMLLPAIIFIWSIIPYNVPPQLYDEYVELISESNNNLENMNEAIVPDSCQLEYLARISELKTEIIKRSGGYEGNRLNAFYGHNCVFRIDDEKEMINNLDIKPKLKSMILNVKINGDAIFLLTQIESILKMKKCH